MAPQRKYSSCLFIGEKAACVYNNNNDLGGLLYYHLYYVKGTKGEEYYNKYKNYNTSGKYEYDFSASTYDFNFKADKVPEYTVKGYYLYGIKAGTTDDQYMNRLKECGEDDANYPFFWDVPYEYDEDTYVRNDLMRTGTEVSQSDENGKHVSYVVIMGDIDGNGVIDITDVIRMKRAMLNLDKLFLAYFKAADFDNSSAIDTTDYIALKKLILGI